MPGQFHDCFFICRQLCELYWKRHNADRLTGLFTLTRYSILVFGSLISTADGAEVCREATYAIANAVSGGTPEQILAVVHHEATAILCALVCTSDKICAETALRAMCDILKCGRDNFFETYRDNLVPAIASSTGFTTLQDLAASSDMKEANTFAREIIERHIIGVGGFVKSARKQ